MLLPDGRVVTVRSIHETDAGALRAFYLGLSDRSLRMRHLGWVRPLSREMAQKMSTVDFSSRFAFIALLGDQVVADCRLLPNDDGELEVAIVVADALQGRGIGKVMLDLALDVVGGRRVVAEVSYDNQPSLGLLWSRGFVRTRWEFGVMEFVHELTLAASRVHALTPTGK